VFETSAYKIQTPGNYPEENIQHTEHGESLKSRSVYSLVKSVHYRLPTPPVISANNNSSYSPWPQGLHRNSTYKGNKYKP